MLSLLRKILRLRLENKSVEAKTYRLLRMNKKLSIKQSK